MITKDMEILEIVDAYPVTEDVFRSYDEATGVCVLCTHLFENVGELAEIYGLDLDKMIERLDGAVGK
ncbi:hypothetical protein [Dethiosulfatibacter aminovorans]|uniref:hypothetical protein n=1 Tax=Dethiosulfatibacter aminovorans TaxID=332095 RepID=UPI001FEBE6EB|nr:hypothetical protein [Dethiosulfatibacter aminovorans]